MLTARFVGFGITRCSVASFGRMHQMFASFQRMGVSCKAFHDERNASAMCVSLSFGAGFGKPHLHSLVQRQS